MRTSRPPKRLTAASASWGLVTSSLTTSRLSESPSASASGLRRWPRRAFLAVRVWLGVRGVLRARREAAVVVGAKGAPHGKGGERDEAERDHDDAEGGWAG